MRRRETSRLTGCPWSHLQKIDLAPQGGCICGVSPAFLEIAKPDTWCLVGGFSHPAETVVLGGHYEPIVTPFGARIDVLGQAGDITLSKPVELYPRPMRLDSGTVLLCGAPGLIVGAIGQIVVVARFFRGRRTSTLGIRLTMAGFGLFLLGAWGAILVASFAGGLWPVAVAVALLFGWQPVLFFWWATRPRVAADKPS